MNTITQQREYYKIDTGLEQNNGSIDLNLFYNASTVEVVLDKDKSTPLHFSFFSQSISFQDSGLIEAGAIAGPVPAIADKIYSSQRGYGDKTFWDNTSYPQHGGWFFTWLFDNSGNYPIWMDRYYYPGSLSAQNDIISEYNKSIYIYGSEDFFIDVPSTRAFEPEGYYEYYHVSDKTYINQTNLLSGIGLSGLGLHISTWSEGSQDISPYKNVLRVKGNTDGALNTIDNSINDTAFLNLSTTNYLDYRIDYSDSYLTDRHFTVMTWLKAENWDDLNTSQIFGNIYNGGYGLFYNSYKNTTFFVLGDSKRNILFFINNNFENYETVDIYKSYGVTLSYYGVDSNNNVFVLDNVKKTITKFDHSGNSPITQAVLKIDTPIYRLFFDIDDNLYITTQNCILQLDNSLIETDHKHTNHICDENTFIIFDNNKCIIHDNIRDIKVVNGVTWFINDKKQLLNNSSATVIFENVNCLDIDPDGYIWCVLEYNKIAKIDPYTFRVIFKNKYEPENNISCTKAITFIYKYTRSTKKHTWYAAVLTNSSKDIYQINKNGDVAKSVHLPFQIGHLTDNILDESLNLIPSYNISSYTCNRIVSSNHNKKLEFRISMKHLNTKQFKCFSISLDRNKLINDEWHHVCVIFNENSIQLYLDTKLINTVVIPEIYIVSHENTNAFYVGNFSGRFTSLGEEIKMNDSTFNGCIDELRIYRYCIEPWFLVLFRRTYINTRKLIWNMPTSLVHNIEKIKGVFKNKLPSSLSNYFNIEIAGIDFTNASDDQIKNIKYIIDSYIRSVIENIKPTTSELLGIEWL